MLEQFILKKNEKKAHSLPFMFRDFDQLHPNILPTIESEIKRLVTQNRLDLLNIYFSSQFLGNVNKNHFPIVIGCLAYG